MGFTSIRVQCNFLAAEQTVWNGFAYGFIFTAIGNNRDDVGDGGQSPVLKVNVRGVGKKGNDVLAVVPGVVYDCPFDALTLVPDPDAALQGFVGGTCGDWIVTIITKPYAVVRPVYKPIAGDYPAASGGNPNSRESLVTQNLNTADPSTGSSVGLLIADASMFKIFVKFSGGGTFTGGTIDLWRRQGSGAQWFLAAQYAPVAGQNQVQIANDYIGPHAETDRLYVKTNNVTLTAGTAVDVFLVLQ